MQKIAQFIAKGIDFLYYPFSNLFPKQLFRYGVCGGANMVLDWILYFLVYNFVVGHQLVYLPPVSWGWEGPCLCLTPHIASFCMVFPVTLWTGFWLNRHVTFHQSSLRGRKQLVRYTLVVLLNLAINYFGLKLCVEHLGWYPTLSKMAITILTVIISFFAQKYYSFRVTKCHQNDTFVDK